MSRQGLFGLSILPIMWESIMENPILIAGILVRRYNPGWRGSFPMDAMSVLDYRFSNQTPCWQGISKPRITSFSVTLIAVIMIVHVSLLVSSG